MVAVAKALSERPEASRRTARRSRPEPWPRTSIATPQSALVPRSRPPRSPSSTRRGRTRRPLPDCVAALCRRCHRAYDTGRLDLLPHLEPRWRAELAHALGHLGLIGLLERVTAERWRPAGVPPGS